MTVGSEGVNTIEIDMSEGEIYTVVERISNSLDGLVGHLCGMETFYKDGNCGRPATHIWTHRDGETFVCDRCLSAVCVNGGDLKPIAPNRGIDGNFPHMTAQEVNR